MPTLERAHSCECDREGRARLRTGALLRCVALLDALDEVRDLRTPRVGRDDWHRDRLSPRFRINLQPTRCVACTDVAAALGRRGTERVLGDAAFCEHAQVARERI